MSALKQIRKHCLECCGTANEVKLCAVPNCALYEYRLGKSPNHKPRQMTDEQRAAAAERLRKARESKQ